MLAAPRAEWYYAASQAATSGRSTRVDESPRLDAPVERLIRQVESRVAAKEQLKDTARGLLGTALIFGGIVALMGMMLAGAIIFATVLTALRR